MKNYDLKFLLPVVLAVIIGVIVSFAVQGFISFVSFIESYLRGDNHLLLGLLIRYHVNQHALVVLVGGICSDQDGRVITLPLVLELVILKDFWLHFGQFLGCF